MYHYIYRVEGQEGRRHFQVDELPHTCHGEPSVEEQIIDMLKQEDRLYGDKEGDYELAFCREYKQRREIGVTTIRIVEIDRCYGGPEEGGWWYDAEQLKRQFTVPTAKAQRLRERLQKYADRCNEGRRSWDRDGRVEVRTGKYEWRERPHYC